MAKEEAKSLGINAPEVPNAILGKWLIFIDMVGNGGFESERFANPIPKLNPEGNGSEETGGQREPIQSVRWLGFHALHVVLL